MVHEAAATTCQNAAFVSLQLRILVRCAVRVFSKGLECFLQCTNTSTHTGSPGTHSRPCLDKTQAQAGAELCDQGCASAETSLPKPSLISTLLFFWAGLCFYAVSELTSLGNFLMLLFISPKDKNIFGMLNPRPLVSLV